jgi:hypothetical protein
MPKRNRHAHLLEIISFPFGGHLCFALVALFAKIARRSAAGGRQGSLIVQSSILPLSASGFRELLIASRR